MRFRHSDTPNLILAIGLAATLIGCDADDGEPTAERLGSEQDAGAGAPGRDAGLDDPWVDRVIPGCDVSDETLETLPEELGAFGSPASIAGWVSGTWTNSGGDRLVVQLENSGRHHEVTGIPASTGGTPGPQCAVASYVAVNASIALTTEDGRFDERFEAEVRMQPNATRFKANVALASLEGTFEANESNDGVLRWDGSYESGAGWGLGGVINRSEPGSAAGGGQVISFEPFSSHE